MKGTYLVSGVIQLEVSANTPEEAIRIAENKKLMLETRHSFVILNLDEDTVVKATE